MVKIEDSQIVKDMLKIAENSGNLHGKTDKIIVHNISLSSDLLSHVVC
jgi:hypothetical protein